MTFEVPRRSLRTALDLEIFDDLLAGNFMRTTLHGSWTPDRLYPDFSPFVGKFADGGRAKSTEDVRRYLAEYRHRAPIDYIVNRTRRRARYRLRQTLDPQSRAYRAARAIVRSPSR